MNKKKKVFIIAYIIILMAISIFMLSKIFAAGNSESRLSGKVKYAEYEATEVGTPIPEITVSGRYADFDVEGKAYGEGFMWDDVTDDDDVFCFDADKHIFSRSVLSQQTIYRTKSVDFDGLHVSEDYVTTVSEEDKGYPNKTNWQSSSFYKAVGEHFCSLEIDLNDLDVEKYNTEYAESYILAQKNNDEYQESYFYDKLGESFSARQFAIWEFKKGGSYSYVDGRPAAERLYKEAIAFADFRENFQLPKLNSNSSDYEFKYNKEGDYFITGPVIMNYPTLQLNSGLTVGKITNATLYGTNSDKEENIEVPFEFANKDGNQIEYPTEGGKFEFYIKVKNSDVKSKKIREITDFKVNFEYLDATGYGYKIINEDPKSPKTYALKYYEWTQEKNHISGCYINTCNGGTKSAESDQKCDEENCPGHSVHHIYEYRLVRNSTPTIKYELQPVFAFAEAELFWRQYELSITFKGLHTYMDIGGKVWVDMPTNDKENDENGKYDGSDYGRQNVLVELFFWDTTPVRVGVKDTLKDSRNTNLINGANGNYAMYTDSNGNYMFYGLQVDQNYYVKFTYDGQTYTQTLYLADGNETDYKNNPNKSIYDSNSKVRDEMDRTGFNNRFKEITYKNMTERTTGRAVGTNTSLRYLDKTYTDNRYKYIKSKIVTTDNDLDAEYGERGVKKQTGKAIDPYEISARTPKTLKYPFEKNGEILIWSTKNEEPLQYLQHVNLGLKVRPKADLALQTQLKAGAMTIKDKEKIVFYKTSASDDELEIDGTNTENEYVKQEIAASDYNWKANYKDIYGDGNVTGYIVDEDKLNVYVLYRIVIQNQCEGVNETGIINELVDYYDNRLELVPAEDREKVKNLFGTTGLNVPNSISSTSSNKYNLSWVEGDTKLVTWTTKSSNGNYNTMLAENLNLQIESDNTSAIYLILKVKENGDVLNTGTNNDKDGMQNIAEITSYSIYDTSTNEYVGKIDKDSAPGNATPGNNSTYEDDTDAAPMFRLEINWAPRKITGNVWDDLNRDGIINEEGKGIQNVTVKLIEHIIDENGYQYEIERPGLVLDEANKQVYTYNDTILTDKDGNYSINVEGGNYSLKFIYGNTEMLYGNYANKKYNGQDYQSTKYTALSSGNVNGYDSSNAFATLEDLRNQVLIVGDPATGIDEGTQPDWETNNLAGSNTYNNLSSVRDLANIRADIIKNTSVITYENGNELIELTGDGSVSNPEVATFLSGNNGQERDHNYTYMESVTDIITIASNDLIKNPKVINLGLRERPTVDVELQKEVKRIVLKTSDGRVLIDSSDSAKLSNLQKLGDLGEEIDSTFINMDTVLMDGATLDIDYEMTVKTTGERDSLSNYISVEGDRAIINTLQQELEKELKGLKDGALRAEVFDYVSINLDFRSDDNTTITWTKVYDEDANVQTLAGIPLSAEAQAVLPKTQKLVSQVLQTTTKDLDTAGDTMIIPMHLGITLSENTSNNDLNDFDFSNCAEIVKVYSGIGRRQYTTIPGNYVPYSDSSTEIDADLTGSTSITPPLGQQRIYYVITILSATILIAGIIVIKKKVLKK